MGRSLLVVALISAACAACAETEPIAQPDAGPESRADASADAGVEADAAVHDASAPAGDAATAILDRPIDPRLTCSVSQPIVNLEPKRFFGTGLAVSGGTAYTARIERTTDGFTPGDPSFLLSTIAGDAALGTPQTITGPNPENVAAPSLIALSDGSLVLLWFEGTDVHFAAFDSQGAQRIAPHRLSGGTADTLSRMSISVGAGDTIAIVYNAPIDFQTSELIFLTTNANGDVLSSPHRFRRLTAANYSSSVALAPAPEGFAMLWSEPLADHAQIFAGIVDMTGALTGPPQQLSATSEETGVTDGFGPATVSLLDVSGGYLAAWSEGSQGDFNNGLPQGAYSVVRVARLDASAKLREAAVTVQTRTNDVDNFEPELQHFGNSVALSWSRGNHIYICAGCVPDDHTQLVMIDPETLTPRSSLVELVPADGGLLRRQMVVLGAELFSIANITFHVSFNTGFGAFHCE